MRNKGNPQVEDGYIRIATELFEALTKAQAKGLITSRERAIIDFVIRYTYGFHEKNGYFKASFIAEKLELLDKEVMNLIRQLIRKKILNRKKNELGINKHYQQWEKGNETVTSKIGNETVTNGNEAVTKSNGAVTTQKVDAINSEQLGMPEKSAIKDNSLNITKDKDISIVSKDTETKLKVKDEIQIKATELIKEFCLLRGIPLDSGFFSKNIRAARSLVNHYEIEVILAGVSWRLQNDENNFWVNKLWTLNSVYSYLAQWIAEASQKPHPKTFIDWLDKNPDCDYRKLYDSAEIKSFFIAFNRAIKDGVTMTPEEWGKYNKARKLNKGGN